MPPSIFRTPDISNQFPFPLEVRKIGIPVYVISKNSSCRTHLSVLVQNRHVIDYIYQLPVNLEANGSNAMFAKFFIVSRLERREFKGPDGIKQRQWLH